MIARARVNLYARTWNGEPLSADEYVISADEKTSDLDDLLARLDRHATDHPKNPQSLSQYDQLPENLWS